MLSILLANTRNTRGIHQRSPASVPSSLRKVNTRPSLSTREAASCVVVIHTPPTIGKLAATTGPAACNRLRPAAGSRKKAWLAKSSSTFMTCPRATAPQSCVTRSATQLAVNTQKLGNCGGIAPAEAALRRDVEIPRVALGGGDTP